MMKVTNKEKSALARVKDKDSFHEGILHHITVISLRDKGLIERIIPGQTQARITDLGKKALTPTKK